LANHRKNKDANENVKSLDTGHTQQQRGKYIYSDLKAQRTEHPPRGCNHGQKDPEKETPKDVDRLPFYIMLTPLIESLCSKGVGVGLVFSIAALRKLFPLVVRLKVQGCSHIVRV
jgi:hypothetical protein